MARPRWAHDRTGEQFGKLLVVGRAPGRQKALHWICRCDCGNETIVLGNRLTRGTAQSCGCERTDRLGQRFGKLLVIGSAPRSKSNLIQWLCRCDCGIIKPILDFCLKRGSISCGCIPKENERKRSSEWYYRNHDTNRATELCT